MPRTLNLIIVLVLSFAGHAYAASVNLLPNPGFESIGNCFGSAWPDNTCPDSYIASHPPSVHIGTTAAAPHRSLEIDFSQATGTDNAGAGFRLDNVKPGELYEFSALVRTELLHGFTELAAYGRDNTGNQHPGQLGRVEAQGPGIKAADRVASSTWQRISMHVEVPEHATVMYFNVQAAIQECNLAHCGSAYFDDLILRRLEENVVTNPYFESTGTCLGTTWPDSSCPDDFIAIGAAPVDFGTVDLGADRAFVADFTNTSGPATRSGGAGYRLENVTPGESYVFSVLLSTEGFKGRTRLVSYGRDSSGTVAGKLGEKTEPGPSTTVADQAVDTPWQRVEMTITVPADADRMYFNFSADTWWHCSSAPCGRALFDNLVIRRVNSPEPLPLFSNPCVEGEFFDLRTMTCHALDKPELGFDQSDFDLNLGPGIEVLASCDEAEFENALTALELTNGGILQLPECVLSLTKGYVLPSNTLVQGAGVGRTLIELASGVTGVNDLLYFGDYYDPTPYSASHLIIRDLSVTSGLNKIGVGTADNVLIERVEVYGGSGKSGLSLWRSHRLTVRHSTARDNFSSGINHSSCDGSSTTVSFADCTGDYPISEMGNYSIVSNDLRRNKIGLVADPPLAEIAGNLILNNTWAAKFINAADRLWVHHNDFSQSADWGIKINNSYNQSDDSLSPDHLVFYKNSIRDNVDWGIRIKRVTDLFLIDNEYTGNGCSDTCVANTLRIAGGANPVPTVFSCPGDTVAATGVSGLTGSHSYLLSTDPKCDLADVENIF